MFAVSSESSFAFSFNIICCSIFQSCRLLCFAVLECNVKPSLIYSGIKCCLCIAKLQHPLKLTLVKDCWLEKSISTSKTTAIHSASWERKFNNALLTSHRVWTARSYLTRILMSCLNMLFKIPSNAKMNQQRIFADCMLMQNLRLLEKAILVDFGKIPKISILTKNVVCWHLWSETDDISGVPNPAPEGPMSCRV